MNKEITLTRNEKLIKTLDTMFDSGIAVRNPKHFIPLGSKEDNAVIIDPIFEEWFRSVGGTV